MQKIIRFYLRRFRVVRIKRKTKKRVSKKYLEHKESARILATQRLEYFNQHYNLKFGKISIRNQKSRWGSCSSKGNLNFNYKIALLPSHLSDYVIVHELCHIGQFNHSQNFWDLVGETLPDYKKLVTELKMWSIKARVNPLIG
ncbi:MAG: putative metal-dependent hydrolase [Parcubacteria bacterium C7867-006]|nr:MAG: putative metal-dependent hydrolase [Parcubacteria bacterium C7867-006]